MPLYGGIDLHANNSVIVLLNEQDEVIYRKRLSNELPAILEQLAPYHAEVKGLVVESTYNWYWLVDGLMEAEYRVTLANPAAIQQYSGLKYTDDHSDARWLAHLLRLGVLPEGYIYPKAARAVRDLLRKRAHLVRQHTANVLSVQNIMARNTGGRFSVKRIQELTKQELTTLLTEETQVLAVTSSLVVLDCLQHRSKRWKRLSISVCSTLRLTSSCSPCRVSGRSWPKRSRWKPARSAAFPPWATMPRIAAVWTVQRSAMASVKARAMSKMGTHI